MRPLMLRALAGEPVERPPFWLMRQAGRYLPEYRALRTEAGSFLNLCFDPARAAEVTLQPIRRFGMDAAILFSDILVVPLALGQSVRFESGEGPVLDAIDDEAGLRRLEFVGSFESLRPVYETVRRVRATLEPDKVLIGFAGSPWTVATYMVEGSTSKQFSRVKRAAFAAETARGGDHWFARLIDMLVEATIVHLSAQAEAGAQIVQLFDTWSGVLPDPSFARWSIEPTARIVGEFKKLWPGVPVIGFPRGAGLRAADYVRETAVDAVGCDSAVPCSWAARVLQPLAAVQGNLDPQLLVLGGVAMREATLRILGALCGGKFIFNLGHGVEQETPPEHVAELAAIVRGWNNAPIQAAR